MKRTTIFIIVSICFGISYWISGSESAAPITFGQIIGAGSALLWQWFTADDAK